MALKSTPVKTPRYGRGKFTAHQAYVEYMRTIIENPTYSTMPNAISEDGHINWQVSSGKSTSFYKFYEARFAWWVNMADKNSIKGSGNSDDRFSITARVIHPTGLRPCRLCGIERNVGYFYANSILSKKINKLIGEDSLVEKAMPVPLLLDVLSQELKQEQVKYLLYELFPERKSYFKEYGLTTIAFEKSNFLRSKWLSPGYMCNPPDRLDGFHDYCIMCREKSDPGRSRENLASYVHDRRVFELWSEGDWLVADKLYSLAGKGKCYLCGKELSKISPDHVGPLACGFKQLALFMPMCQSCNSSKNRRMTLDDIQILIAYEVKHEESVASWQVRALWDSNKHLVKNDRDAKELSDLMRSMQDIYIRTLNTIYTIGLGGLSTIFLHPEYAGYKVEFIGLDTSTLTFKEYVKKEFNSRLRLSLAGRVVRIAFEELELYAKKEFADRKLRKDFQAGYSEHMGQIVEVANKYATNERVIQWHEALAETNPSTRQSKILALLEQDKQSTVTYPDYEKIMRSTFTKLGNKTFFTP